MRFPLSGESCYEKLDGVGGVSFFALEYLETRSPRSNPGLKVSFLKTGGGCASILNYSGCFRLLY